MKGRPRSQASSPVIMQTVRDAEHAEHAEHAKKRSLVGLSSRVRRVPRLSRHTVYFFTVGMLAFSTASAKAQDVDAGRDSLRAGRYKEAISILSRVPPSDSNWIAAQRFLVEAYTTTGKYDDAELAARKATAAKGGAEL